MPLLLYAFFSCHHLEMKLVGLGGTTHDMLAQPIDGKPQLPIDDLEFGDICHS